MTTKSSNSKIVHVANIDFRDDLVKKIEEDGFGTFSSGIYKILHDYVYGKMTTDTLQVNDMNTKLDELIKLEEENQEKLSYIASKLDTTVTDIKLAILGTFSKANLDNALDSMRKELETKKEKEAKQKAILQKLRDGGNI